MSEEDGKIFSTTLIGQRIVYFTIRRPPETEADWEAYRKAFLWYYDNIDKFAICYDLRDIDGISEYFIEKKINLLQEVKEKTGKVLVCTAVILNSPVFVTLLNMLLERYQNKRPVQTFDNDSDATRWLTSMMIQNLGPEAASKMFE